MATIIVTMLKRDFDLHKNLLDDEYVGEMSGDSSNEIDDTLVETVQWQSFDIKPRSISDFIDFCKSNTIPVDIAYCKYGDDYDQNGDYHARYSSSGELIIIDNIDTTWKKRWETLKQMYETEKENIDDYICNEIAKTTPLTWASQL
ncbi:hypothetical protein A1QO_04155 [Vibrio genomosp. F10 str. ZF-129]|uniref:Uncharacterized protein n=1 Tax=Vibrio genomosp. F10 str. ZF-129 TaxID=1187848 RepID=A0A1E5BIM9_9VIBR|nr:hypothetical protein [Vibrio genomosp. F10]OEE37305.1 hypothetical protein A1QO_04155 [Vibrio genomosp. F10 str. ZF-129]